MEQTEEMTLEKERIREWYENNLHYAIELSGDDLHLDRILSKPAPDRRSLVVSAVACYQGWLDMIDRDTLLLIAPSLCIPLRSSDEIAAAIPTDEEIFTEDFYEPPSLQMIGRNAATYYSPVDEVRMVLKSPWDLRVSNGMAVCSYACLRRFEGRHQGWEWARAVFCKAYPKELFWKGDI
jgi:hypothetical protein